MFDWCPVYGTNASWPYMAKPDSTVTKTGRLRDLGRASRYKVLMCICINFCDKESASSLLNCRAKKKKREWRFAFWYDFQSSASFHHLSPIFCLHCYNKIISLFKGYRSFDHWCAMDEFFPHFITVKRTKGENLTSAQSFKLSSDWCSCFWLFSILALWCRL